ncbi:hypothetical protein V4P56_02555 [Bartonella sp. B35(2025)]
MTNFKIYTNFDSNNCEKIFLKKIYPSLKELMLIGSLNGSVSGAIAAILSTYGYIALPGFGPIIAMGVGTALLSGIIIGTTIGSIIGVVIGVFCTFVEDFFIS